MEIIKTASEWARYKDKLSTSYGYNSATNNFDILKKNSKAHNPYDNPICFPCLVCSTFINIDDYHNEYVHEFVYLHDSDLVEMFNYKIKLEELNNMKKDELAIYLVDPDETIRNMAKEIYNDLK